MPNLMTYPRDAELILMYIIRIDVIFLMSYPIYNMCSIELIDLSPIWGTRLYYVQYCIEWFPYWAKVCPDPRDNQCSTN